MPAAGAAVAVSAEHGGAAALNGPDDFLLRPGDTGAAALQKAAPAGTEDVGHLQGGLGHDTTAAAANGRASNGLGAARSTRVERWR